MAETRNYKLYRKMCLDEYDSLSTSGLTINRGSSIILCPRKCLSESLISVYRLNPYRNALSQVIAEFSFPVGFRDVLFKNGQGLSHTMHSDRVYSRYERYKGLSLYYKCHGAAIELYNHEIDESHLQRINNNIVDVSVVNPDDYTGKLLQNYLNVSDFEALVTRRELDPDEYYIQLPADLAILALRFNAIPPGGLNKFIKSRVLAKDYEYLDQLNNGVFPITLAVRIDRSLLLSRIKDSRVARDTYAIGSEMIHYFNKIVKGIRVVGYNEERAHYKYASDVLNDKVSVSDILSKNISEDGFQYGDNQITLDQALCLMEDNPIKEYFTSTISNINESLYLPSDYHGKTHAERVCLLAFIMATYMKIPEKETKILIKASLLHDIGRTSECDDANHGHIGAEKIDELALFMNDEYARNMVKFLIGCHELEFNETTIAELMNKYNISDSYMGLTLLSILMDADALDRTRFTVFENSSSGLNPEYLRTSISKRLISISKFISKVYYNNSGMIIKKK